MKFIKSITFLFLICFIVSLSESFAQSSTIGNGWAKNAVNTPIFRKNSVVSYNGKQYVAFYDSSGFVVIAKRLLGTKDWQIKRTNYIGNVSDAHNSISIMVDGDGYLHMSWDHHGNALRYCKSLEPGSLELTEKLSMTGHDEVNVTYPEFHKLANGNLLFLYRNGGSGRGNLVINEYDLKEKIWRRLHNVLIDGQDQRNAYWQAAIDPKGTLHVSWVWRESGDVASNHDMCYAKSKDGGKTWQKSTGEIYDLPITAASAEYAWKIPQKSELINQTSMCADAEGKPYIASYWRPKDTAVPQYQLVYNDGKQWQCVQISQRTKAFSLSGTGTKKIPISRPQIIAFNKKGTDKAIVIFRDEERDSRASISICNDLQAKRWSTKDLTKYSLGNWEPSYDTELWKNSNILDLFIQYVGQGDGEKLENIPPQPVSILEWKP